ncbi:hypothetical protein [Aeromonas hydrophila]|uniref:hypothetical protein n=1 Tax=Aeromonas hydrophila TaxID=644 RepID=UPI0024415545|nr:hypothetical protein [Aeromonas hydrophila]
MAKFTEKGLPALLKQAFSGYNQEDADNHNIPLQAGPGGTGMLWNTNPTLDAADPSQGASAQGDQWMAEKRLPDDRFAKYALLQDMANDPLLSGGIDLHISHALSVNAKTGLCVSIEAKSPADADLAAALMADLGDMINLGAPGWCKNMAVFGAHYVRPYAEQGKGIVDIESSWYTMANQIREYVRGGRCAGFTSEYLKEKAKGGAIKLVEPWQLVALRIPYWQPKLHLQPVNLTGQQYSLYDDLYHRTPTETQDYGTSLLEFCYPAWCDLSDALRSLKGSRYNASRIERFITLGMDNLDPVQSANYLNLVGTQLRKDLEALAAKSKRTGLVPTVINRLIPALSGSKGGVNIDTQMISPDIQHIEDVMFHLKRMSGGMGIDVSMLGWGDLMSGGLGDGGFFRTSIQAAQRANWLRIGLRAAIDRLIDIHMAHKYGKIFPAGEARPIAVKFHSLNTAIELEESEARESRTNWAMSLATLLDMIENGQLSHSNTLKEKILNEAAGFDPETTKNILAELASAQSEEGDAGMMESLGSRAIKQSEWEAVLAPMVNKHIINILGE